MSKFVRNTARPSLKPFLGCALALIAGFTVPSAKAQLPGVLAFGARTQVSGYPVGTLSTAKIARDAAGDIFFLQNAPAVYEIPVNGPVQIVVPSTDVSMTSGPTGLAVDPSGNIYVGGTSKLFEVPRNANGTYGATVAIATNLLTVTGGYYQTKDLAVDNLHDIYVVTAYGIATINSSIASPAGTGARYILGTNLTTPVAAPVSVALDAAGDLFYADGTNAWEYPSAMLQGSTTVTATQIGSPTTGNCTGCTALATPKYVFLDAAGNLYVGSGSSIYIVPNNVAFSSASPTYVLPNGQIKTSSFANMDNNGNLFAIYSGALEFYGAGKFFFQPIAGVTVGTPIAVGAVSSTSYASPTTVFVFTQAATLSATTPVAIVNSGAANGAAGPTQNTIYTTSNTTCTAGLVVAAGGSCTVELGYTIKDPGAVSSSLQLYGSTSNTLASVNITSIATGSALAIDGGVTTPVGTGYLSPAGLAVDTTGATYVADPASNTIFKYAAGSTAAGTAIVTSTTAVSGGTAGLSEPSAVALDAAGDLYIADTANDRVVVVPNSITGLLTNAAAVLPTPGYALSSPHGVAVDSFGNVFISDTGNARVVEVPNPFSNAIGPKPTLVASGLNTPYGIAFDAYNDLFIADPAANAVYEVPTALLTTSTVIPTASVTNAGSGVLTTVGSGLAAPIGVATDASGSVYITDSGNKRVVKVPSESGVLTTADQTVLFANLNKPYGIATDLTADIYFTDQAAPSLSFVKRSAPSGSNATTINFGTVATASTGAATALLSNTGLTTSLTFGATAVTSPATPFSQTSNACANASTLLPGKSCSVALGYSPTATGNSTGSFTITDNALAVTTATQTVSLTGDATGAISTLSVTGPTSIVYGDTATFTITAKDSGGNVISVPSGTAYTLTITGGAGSASPYSGTFNPGGTFILPTLSASSTPYSLTVTTSSITSSPAVSLTIGKAPLYLTATNVTRPFDVANPALAATYSGFANGDTASVVTGTPAIATTATRTSPYGTYPITVSGTLTAANYTITLVSGVFSVTGTVPQAIIFPPLPNFTNGTTVTLTGQSTSGLPVTYTVTGGSVSGSTLTVGAAGTVTVTATQGGNNTYAAATSVTRTFTAQ